MSTRRQATIYLNGKPVENQIQSLIAVKKKLNNEINLMVIGSEKYVETSAKIQKINDVLNEHRNQLAAVAEVQKVVQGSLNDLYAQQKKITEELSNMVIGSQEYNAKAAELKKVNLILDEHRKKLSNLENEQQAVEGSLKAVRIEQKKVTAELEDMVIGSEEYISKVKELKRINGILNEHRDNLNDVTKSYNLLTSGGITKLAGLTAGAFSADVILSYGKHLFDLSGQMELLEAKARTVFAEVFPQVTAEAERNATALGLTNSQYIANAASIADLLIPMKFSREEAAGMSTTLVNLSGALSEWTGGQISATDVSKTISKAILGEREELKSLGIAISEEDVKNRLRAKGLQDLTGDYLAQAKAVATMELILEKSTDAQTAFANNSDTMVRRQAQLRAEFTNISEKLATVLLPVFERLIGIAGSFVSGLANMADGFTALVNPAKGATDAFNDQAAKVSKLEKELPPLLDRYDELKGKSNLTKKEQVELSKVIQQIGVLTPTAITEIDNYGRALGISASASRDFLEAEQERLKIINKDKIEEYFKAAVRIREQRDKLKQQVASGVKELTTVTLGGTTTQFLSLSAKEIEDINAEVAKLTKTLTGYRQALKVEKGQPLVDLAPGAGTTPPPTAPSAGGTSKATKAKIDEVQKGEDAIQKILEKYRQENALLGLDAEQEKIAATRAEYDKSIKEIESLEKVKGEKINNAIIELERLREEEVSQIRDDFRKQREDKDAEAAQAELDKELEATSARIKANLENQAALRDAIKEFVLSDYEKSVQELDTQYQTLLATANIGEETKLALLRAYEEKKAILRKEYADKEKLELVTKTKERNEILAQSYAAYANIIGGALTALGGILGEQTAASKVLTLAQIAFNTAAAISSAVAAGAGLGFPANLGAIASGVTAVLSNFAAARKLFNSAPAVPQRYTGGFYDVKGQDDGRSYNAQYLGSPGTGLLPNRPVLLASERGQEYLISNPDLQNPRVLNYVRAIENIRQARTGGGGIAQYAEGGFTANNGGANNALAQLAPLLMQVAAVLGSLDNTLADGIEAKMGDEAVLGFVSRFRVLNNASGGVL
jgi:hypothetical protein